MYVDIRDLVEWAARCPVVELVFCRGQRSGMARACTVTFGSAEGASRTVTVLHGKEVRNNELDCVVVGST